MKSRNNKKILTSSHWKTMGLYSLLTKRALGHLGLAAKQRVGSTQGSLRDFTCLNLATDQALIINSQKLKAFKDWHRKIHLHLQKS